MGFLPSSFPQNQVERFPPDFALPVGTGFFVKAAGTTPGTNTYVGNVIPNPGGNSTNSLPNATFVLVGSSLPVGGALNDVGTNTLNLVAVLPNKSQVQVWDVPTQGFLLSSKSSGAFSPNFFNSSWSGILREECWCYQLGSIICPVIGLS